MAKRYFATGVSHSYFIVEETDGEFEVIEWNEGDTEIIHVTDIDGVQILPDDPIFEEIECEIY